MPNEIYDRSGLEAPDLKPDKENAFLLYAIFCGDVQRTAHALDLPPETIAALAAEHKWDTKLKPIIDLKNSTRAGDVERAVNRALNFVSAHRMRIFLGKVLKLLTDLSREDLATQVIQERINKEGNTYHSLATRAFADLASAMEKCQAMTYLALNDTATERKERGEDDNESATAAELHVRLADAMSRSGGPATTIRGMVAEAQLAIAQEHARIELNPPKLEDPDARL